MKTIEIDGEQFELIEASERKLGTRGDYLLRPVPVGPEPKYKVEDAHVMINAEYSQCISVRFNSSDETAEKVREAVEALVAYMHNGRAFHNTDIYKLALDAWKSIDEEN